MNSYERFTAFERRYKMFDLQDSNGVYIWDIVRYQIYQRIKLGNISNSPTSRLVQVKRIILCILNICSFSFLILFLRKKTYLFFLASRNKQEGGKYFDQNAFAAINLLPREELLLIESSGNVCFLDTLYKELPLFNCFPTSLVRYFKQLPKYDFSYVINLLREEYSSAILFDELYLTRLYNQFYSQKIIFKFLLKKKQIQKVFLTQNGIQKGMIAAVKELNIRIYEFQHGIVNRDHLAYSYPDGVNPSNVYLPHKIASLSGFWFKDCILPGVRIVPLGNDFFNIKKNSFSSQKELLVVSANIFGICLRTFLKNILEGGLLKDYTINFKLHPNQFHEYEDYINFFQNTPNVIVWKNNKSISQLLVQCNTLFAVQSTAIYEALQAGRKAIILKGEFYNSLEHIYAGDNVFLIKTQEEFVKALNAEIISSDNNVYFAPFNQPLFLKEFVND